MILETHTRSEIMSKSDPETNKISSCGTIEAPNLILEALSFITYFVTVQMMQDVSQPRMENAVEQ